MYDGCKVTNKTEVLGIDVPVYAGEVETDIIG
jgi:hypothetical protein